MTERTKTIKGLISGQVDMGTFGLVELELLAIENDNEALRKHAVSGRSELLRAYFRWHKEQGFVSHKDSDIDGFLASNSH